VRRVVAIVVGALALIVLPATAAGASFRVSAWATTTVSTATVAAPTALTNSSSCNIVTQNLAVSWTASTTTRATGYTVSVTVGGVTTDYPTTTTSFSRFTLLGAGKTYTVSVKTVLGSWTSTANPAITVVC
jgi:hypothetical protein